VSGSDLPDRLAGTILGAAVGDALGLPRENMRPGRARKLFGSPPLRHRFLFGRGMVSDDTEHLCMVGQSLLRAPNDPARFARVLAWKLRWWLLGLPVGIGRTTLHAILRLWLGFAPERSGLCRAGNGPAMRTALLGVCLGHDPEKLRAYVLASTRLTHTDPRAEQGALLVALAAYHAATHAPGEVTADSFFAMLRNSCLTPDAELTALLEKMEDHLRQELPAAKLAETLGLKRGVTGYIYRTVPLAVYCWLRSPGDFRAAVEEVILLGGDADTTAAITGAVIGATVGVSGIPRAWLDGLLEWPRSARWMRRLARRLAEQRLGSTEAPGEQVFLFWPGLMPRNLLFLLVVFAHVFRRLLPPYS